MNYNEKIAYEKGYRCIDGDVYYNNRKLSGHLNTNGYLCFTFVTGSRTDNTRKSLKCKVHRLVAYQKYGDELYNCDCVRHCDNNKLNNTDDNILIGSHTENSYDRDPLDRKEHALVASSKIRKLSDDDLFSFKDYFAICIFKKKDMYIAEIDNMFMPFVSDEQEVLRQLIKTEYTLLEFKNDICRAYCKPDKPVKQLLSKSKLYVNAYFQES